MRAQNSLNSRHKQKHSIGHPHFAAAPIRGRQVSQSLARSQAKKRELKKLYKKVMVEKKITQDFLDELNNMPSTSRQVRIKSQEPVVQVEVRNNTENVNASDSDGDMLELNAEPLLYPVTPPLATSEESSHSREIPTEKDGNVSQQKRTVNSTLAGTSADASTKEPQAMPLNVDIKEEPVDVNNAPDPLQLMMESLISDLSCILIPNQEIIIEILDSDDEDILEIITVKPGATTDVCALDANPVYNSQRKVSFKTPGKAALTNNFASKVTPSKLEIGNTMPERSRNEQPMVVLPCAPISAPPGVDKAKSLKRKQNTAPLNSLLSKKPMNCTADTANNIKNMPKNHSEIIKSEKDTNDTNLNKGKPKIVRINPFLNEAPNLVTDNTRINNKQSVATASISNKNKLNAATPKPTKIRKPIYSTPINSQKSKLHVATPNISAIKKPNVGLTVQHNNSNKKPKTKKSNHNNDTYQNDHKKYNNFKNNNNITNNCDNNYQRMASVIKKVETAFDMYNGFKNNDYKYMNESQLVDDFTIKYLQMAVVNLAERNGRIYPCYQGQVVRAITEAILATINSNFNYTPRFYNSGWHNGNYLIDCADVSSREILIAAVAKVPILWQGGCLLSVIRRGTFHSYRRIQILLGNNLPNYEQFLGTLTRQNPELNIWEWRFIDYCKYEYGGFMVTFHIDGDSYDKLRRTNGIVYYGLGQLIFYLYPYQPLDKNFKLLQSMMRCNGQAGLNRQHDILNECVAELSLSILDFLNGH